MTIGKNIRDGVAGTFTMLAATIVTGGDPANAQGLWDMPLNMGKTTEAPEDALGKIEYVDISKAYSPEILAELQNGRETFLDFEKVPFIVLDDDVTSFPTKFCYERTGDNIVGDVVESVSGDYIVENPETFLAEEVGFNGLYDIAAVLFEDKDSYRTNIGSPEAAMELMRGQRTDIQTGEYVEPNLALFRTDRPGALGGARLIAVGALLPSGKVGILATTPEQMLDPENNNFGKPTGRTIGPCVFKNG